MNKSVQELTAGFPVVVELDVRWGDMDCFNHVNNVQYLRYFESVRMVYFETLGVEDFLGTRAVGPILAETSCKFKFPLTYPDRISVAVRATDLQEDRFRHRYRIVSHRHRRVAAEGDGLIVSYDYRIGRKAPIPDDVRSRIQELEITIT